MTVQLSHLDKVFFPDDGITKGDLVSYYQQTAPHILGYLRGRPLVLDRYPDGITRRTEVGKQGGAVCHVLADRPDTLVYLANQGTVEFHVFLSRVTALDRPDQLVFDLDPPSDDRFDAVRGFARDVAVVLAARYPDELTVEQRKQQRGDRLYLDIMRNAYAQTVVAPYTVRARPGATVATPLEWDEVEDSGLRPQQLTIRSIAARLEPSGDPWRTMARHRRGLAAARRRLAMQSAAPT